MLFQNRRQKIVAVLMSIWLCSWVCVALLHGVTHTTQGDIHFNAPCLTCSLLHQPAPAELDFSFAPRVVRVFECVVAIRVESVPQRAQAFFSISSRGPPLLLFV